MKTLNAEMLISGCADDSQDTGITIRTVLEPLGGDGAPVKPATYEGGRFQGGRRWWGEGGDRRVVDLLVIDNEPSQANRLEFALKSLQPTFGLPEISLDLSSAGLLPPHLPKEISSFQFPHRNADAYLRDAVLGGVKFPYTEEGAAIFKATADNPEALLRWFPQALVFGFWQSHLGKKRSQAKLARAWVSEIVGIDPAAADVRRMGLKGDPLNLNVADAVEYPGLNPEEWLLVEKVKNSEKGKNAEKGGKLSDIGHGQVPVGDDGALAGVSFREVVQQSSVSFAGLRNVRFQSGAAEARAMLVALGLVAHVSAFGRSFFLRSGADLRPASAQWVWLGANNSGDVALKPLAIDTANVLFRECIERAEGAGLPVGTKWPAPLIVEPNPSLLSAIQKTWPVS